MNGNVQGSSTYMAMGRFCTRATSSRCCLLNLMSAPSHTVSKRTSTSVMKFPFETIERDSPAKSSIHFSNSRPIAMHTPAKPFRKTKIQPSAIHPGIPLVSPFTQRGPTLFGNRKQHSVLQTVDQERHGGLACESRPRRVGRGSSWVGRSVHSVDC